MKVRLTNIQRFSLQDGPGIRTTVFLKGCSLRCPWCSNPENINYDIEIYRDGNVEKQFGYDLTLDELEKEILKDKEYYKLNNGGVTFSGGEALLQIDKLEPLLNELKNNGINICVETSLFSPTNNLAIAIKYVDEFIVDIKLLNEQSCKKYLNGNIELYKQNIELLFSSVSSSNILFRIPVSSYLFEDNNIDELISFIKLHNNVKIEIFQLHNFANKKYEVLNRKICYNEKISEEQFEELLQRIKEVNNNVQVIRI